MAQSARDPLFWSALDVANHDVPGIGDFCLRCHTPGAWLDGRSEPPQGSPDGCALRGPIDDAFSTDFDGVTCHLCHRMMVNPSPPPGEQTFYLGNAQYWIDDSDCDGQGEPCRRGPYEYPGAMDVPPPHPYAFSSYHRRSDLCGTCHNVTSPVRNLIVNGVDQGIRFPMERTHKEWERRAYGIPGPSEATCQGCHMPKITADPVYACVFADNNRTSNMRQHAFVGGNAWVPDVIRQTYPSLMLEEELALIRAAAIDLLEHRSAAVAITVASHVVPGSTLQADVKVTNLTGHKLPTGYVEGRRMWLHVTARDGALAPIWESGAYDASSGVLTQDAALKVYRADHGVWNRHGTQSCDHEDPLGRPLFHAVMNDCIALDNRIPPLGFRGGADLELRPVGHSYPETFPGSGTLVNYDRTAYTIPIPPGAVSPITVTAELRYQTTSKEYVDFQRDEAVVNGFPNDCIERVNGPLNVSRGRFLHDVWTQSGRSAPVTMGAASGASTLVAHVTPGEASRAVDMRITSYDRSTGDVTISYQPASEAPTIQSTWNPVRAAFDDLFSGLLQSSASGDDVRRPECALLGRRRKPGSGKLVRPQQSQVERPGRSARRLRPAPRTWPARAIRDRTAGETTRLEPDVVKLRRPGGGKRHDRARRSRSRGRCRGTDRADRLPDVAVRVKVVGLPHVRVGVRAGEHDDGNPPQRLIGLDLLEQLPSVLARKIQVQQDEVDGRSVGVAVAPEQEFSRLLPVAHDVEMTVHEPVPQRLPHQTHVPGIVLDHQDLDRLA